MLGWDVIVLRKLASSTSNETADVLLASWETGILGLRWLEELVTEGKAVNLGGNGYPNRFAIPAKVLLPIITAGLPANQSPIVFGDDYFLPKGWNSTVKLNRLGISECPSDEQLVVEAWDQS